MRLAWLLLAIPGVYAQSMFDPIKDLAISLGPENINLLLTFWISYLILNFAIKLTPIFGSDSAHNQGGSIAAAMAAATTYFVYITKFNFIGAIMPFIVFLVVGALLLLISKLFGKTGGFKSGRLIVTGILMILISLTLMGSESLYATAILGSTLSWLPETIFAIGIVLIMLGGVMTLKAPTGDSKITDSDILKAAGKPVGWLWSKTGGKLWNRFRGTPEEAPDIPSTIPSTTTTTPAEQTSNHENTNLTEGVVVAHEANIFPSMISELKRLSTQLKEVISEFSDDKEELTNDLKLIDKFSEHMNSMFDKIKLINYVYYLIERNYEDLGQILQLTASWNQKWGGNIDKTTFSEQANEYRQIRSLYNQHEVHKQKYNLTELKAKIKHKHVIEALEGDVSKIIRFVKEGTTNKSTVTEILEEERDLENTLILYANLIEDLVEENNELVILSSQTGTSTKRVSKNFDSLNPIVINLLNGVQKLEQISEVVRLTSRSVSSVQTALSHRLKDSNYNLVNDKDSSDYGAYILSKDRTPLDTTND